MYLDVEVRAAGQVHGTQAQTISKARAFSALQCSAPASTMQQGSRLAARMSCNCSAGRRRLCCPALLTWLPQSVYSLPCQSMCVADLTLYFIQFASASLSHAVTRCLITETHAETEEMHLF